MFNLFFFPCFFLICLLLQFDFCCYSICYVQSSYLCFVHTKKFTRSPLNYMPLILLVFSPYFGLVMLYFVPFLVFYYMLMIDMFNIVLLTHMSCFCYYMRLLKDFLEENRNHVSKSLVLNNIFN